MSALQARSSSIINDVGYSKKLEEEISLDISTTIRGNNAADNAVQFNAPVAGTIIYWYVVHLILTPCTVFLISL
jgi:hypothetical protein